MGWLVVWMALLAVLPAARCQGQNTAANGKQAFLSEWPQTEEFASENQCNDCHLHGQFMGGVPDDFEAEGGLFTYSGKANTLTQFGGFVAEFRDFGLRVPNFAPDAEGVKDFRKVTALWSALALIPLPSLQAAVIQQANEGRVSGRLPILADGRTGRVGSQLQHASIFDFVAEAFLLEMGVRDPDAQDVGSCDNSVACITNWINTLRPPPRRDTSGFPAHTLQAIADGEAIFNAAGCTDCHTQFQTLHTGEVVEVWSDGLLHDLGPSNASDVNLGTAQKGEWRTAWLAGIRAWSTKDFMHQGIGLKKAIRRHGGEAEASVQKLSSPELDEFRDRWEALEQLGQWLDTL